MGHIHIYSGKEELTNAVAQRWAELSKQAIAKHGAFHAALSGGSTPRMLYERLAMPDLVNRIDWSKTYLYFGDERSVPLDNADSNYRMAKESLLDHINISTSQVFPMQAAAEDIHACANDYASILKGHLPTSEQGGVRFDLILLGIGDDGHTASLFPDTEILNQHEKLVDAVYVKKLNTWRMSLTLPVINDAQNIIVLVSGGGKADILHQVLDEPPRSRPFPIQLIEPHGTMEWYVDAAAAQKLSQGERI